MFRGKCFSTLLLLSVLSTSWANPDPNAGPNSSPGNIDDTESTEVDNTKDIHKGLTWAGTALELGAWITAGIGTLPDMYGYRGVADGWLASIAKWMPGVTPGKFPNEIPRFRAPHPRAGEAVVSLTGNWGPDYLGSARYLNSFKNFLLYNQAARLLPAANDYACGIYHLNLEDGWYIDSVLMNQGSIQNSFQFDHIGDNLYIPKSRGLTNQLMVKQITGLMTASNIYYTEKPIDFYVTVSDGRQTSTLLVQKGACTLYNVGPTNVSVVKGDDVPFCLMDPSPDTNIPQAYTKVFASYSTPAFMLLPGEGCVSNQVLAQ